MIWDAEISQDIERYERDKERYHTLGKRVSGYLESKIVETQAAVLPLLHSVNYRIKDRKSLQRKLRDRQYRIEEIEDICGVRIIFYFKDDMERFLANFPFEDYFGTYAKESLDRKLDEYSNQFGYSSIHFTAKVTPHTIFYDALRERERKLLQGLACEVQVRTILQHAWAETAHDIIYKRKATPGDEAIDLGRKKSERLWLAMSATLELLDEQLVSKKLNLGKEVVPLQTIPEKFVIPGWVGRKNLYVYNGQELPYILIHQGSLEEIQIKEDWNLFNVDASSRIPGFKDRVWRQIIQKDPFFIDTLQSYDSSIVRIMKWNPSQKKLFVQPALYSDQIVTNHEKAQACLVDGTKEVRALALDDDGELLDFEQSPLVNSIGVACVIRAYDDYWIIGRRLERLSVFSGRWACPVSGAVEWRERGAWSPDGIKDWIETSLCLECQQELGLEVDSSSLVYLGLARELRRLGKPQFFFLVDLQSGANRSPTSNSIKAGHRIYAVDHELSKLKAITRDDVKKLISKDWEKVMEVTDNENVSEELIMNLCLAFDHLAKYGSSH